MMFTSDPYQNCTLCPRNCSVDRHTAPGYCGGMAQVKAARAGLHFYEEPYLSGQKGSGTVFFSGCALQCVFCQNASISRENFGFGVSEERLPEIFLETQDRGAHNVNLVTGSHYVPTIAKALERAKAKGLTIPVIWNSGGYEKPETLQMLSGLVDVWLPDFKARAAELGRRYFNAPDYGDWAKQAIDFMVKDAGAPVFDENDMMIKGVTVRHLVMPGAVEESKAVIEYLYQTYGNTIWLSLMSQYTPIGTPPYPELRRPITAEEYDAVVDYALDLGVENCLIQEGDSVGESFIPIFDGEGIL